MSNSLEKLTEGSIKTNVKELPKTEKPLIDPAPQRIKKKLENMYKYLPEFLKEVVKPEKQNPLITCRKCHGTGKHKLHSDLVLRQKLSRLDLSNGVKSSIENGKHITRLKASSIDKILKLMA